MSNLPVPQSRNDEYLNELCKRKLAPLVALNAVNANSLSPELNLTGANSIKFYVEITGTGTVQIDILGACESGGVFIGNGVSKYFSTSQSFMLPCTSDFIKVQVTILSGSPIVTVRAQGMSDVGVDDVVPRYRDLGECINGVNVAAGASITSPYYDGVWWVKNIISMTSSDQVADFNITRRDVGSINDWSSATKQSLPASGVNWQAFQIGTGVAVGVSSASLGYSAKFVLKNASANTATYLKARIQLMGV